MALVQPTLQMIQQCFRTLLTAEAGSSSSSSSSSSNDSSSSSSSSVAAKGAGSVQANTFTKNAFWEASGMQAAIIRFVHVVASGYSSTIAHAEGHVSSVAVHQVQRWLRSDVVATATLQRLAAFHQLLRQHHLVSGGDSSNTSSIL
jgi:hypothetical protein